METFNVFPVFSFAAGGGFFTFSDGGF